MNPQTPIDPERFAALIQALIIAAQGNDDPLLTMEFFLDQGMRPTEMIAFRTLLLGYLGMLLGMPPAMLNDAMKQMTIIGSIQKLRHIMIKTGMHDQADELQRKMMMSDEAYREISDAIDNANKKPPTANT